MADLLRRMSTRAKARLIKASTDSTASAGGGSAAPDRSILTAIPNNIRPIFSTQRLQLAPSHPPSLYRPHNTDPDVWWRSPSSTETYTSLPGHQVYWAKGVSPDGTTSTIVATLRPTQDLDARYGTDGEDSGVDPLACVPPASPSETQQTTDQKNLVRGYVMISTSAAGGNEPDQLLLTEVRDFHLNVDPGDAKPSGLSTAAAGTTSETSVASDSVFACLKAMAQAVPAIASGAGSEVDISARVQATLISSLFRLGHGVHTLMSNDGYLVLARPKPADPPETSSRSAGMPHKRSVARRSEDLFGTDAQPFATTEQDWEMYRSGLIAGAQ